MSAPGVPISHHGGVDTDKRQVENQIHSFCCLEKAMVESLQKSWIVARMTNFRF
jgi:hypothetical protein